MVSVFPAPPLRWVVAPRPDSDLVTSLATRLGLPTALAALLVQRGQHSEELARRFLKPALAHLSDPGTLAGMAEAVEAIAATVRAGGSILVHGDYDVDGQCATALLTRALRAAGAAVTAFVPHRLRDGYDFGPAGLAAAQRIGASLVVTCDCGITAVETVRAARAAGIGVVVTDHHLPGPELPPALAVVDPQRPDDTSGAHMLCGTGIAFKLVQALVPALGLSPNLPYHLLDYVALATVADVVPLAGENRVLVRLGLKLLRDSRWPGLRALIEASGLGGREVRAAHLGYILGPRLNAAGRIGDAADGLRLLLTDDPAEAAELARRLEALNVERQVLDRRMLEEALAQVEQTGDPERHAALVLAGDGWHPGVVGIVASRVVERYGRPAFLIAFDGDVGKGSGRSISRFDLHAALLACGDLLERYGGHQMAAGLTIRRDRLDAFRDRFAEFARGQLGPDDLGPEQRVDLELGLHEATAELERLCRHLEPCGAGNASPVFGVRGVRLTGRSRVGNGHLKATLDDGTTRLAAIGFQWADRVPWLGDGLVDAAFRLDTNEWNGNVTLQARLCAVGPHEGGGRADGQTDGRAETAHRSGVQSLPVRPSARPPV
ncbi:MAG TPA: single-stranded-DNA-specific exonuclease RecJ [Gemmatimonadales bacterium]